jgi:hypothetical protein
LEIEVTVLAAAYRASIWMKSRGCERSRSGA